MVLTAALTAQGCIFETTGQSAGPDTSATTSPDDTTTMEPTTEPLPSCGDGVMQPGESCDAGPANDQYAACNNACILNICGDGVRGPDEQCDDGDADENNACTSKCDPPRCGDGFIQLPEEICDDANANESDDCTTRCAPPECGDGILSGEEECDLGTLNANSDHCTKMCKIKVCGDGFVQPGEACDGGIEPLAPCTAECQFDTCGNGMLDDPPEVCDDPFDPNCTSICTVNVCGDGFLNESEACDDGNLIGNDGCAADCTVSVCGDGELAADEDCDDGNTNGGDACGPSCVRDTRYVFVSSLRYAAGALGSVSFADSECQEMAQAAALPGNYKAWLSNGAVSPATRFSKSLDQAYVLPFSMQIGAAKLVADSWVDLVDGSLKHEINVTEKGEQLSFGSSCETATQIAWTATSASAGPYDTTTTCDQWLTSVPQKFGVAGLIGSTGSDWTEGCPMARCDLQARLYCFEQA